MTVTEDTPVIELFTPCSTDGVAVAVTDESGKLTGVVTRERLLAVLGEPMKPTAQTSMTKTPKDAVPAPRGEGDEPVKKVSTGA